MDTPKANCRRISTEDTENRSIGTWQLSIIIVLLEEGAVARWDVTMFPCAHVPAPNMWFNDCTHDCSRPPRDTVVDCTREKNAVIQRGRGTCLDFCSAHRNVVYSR